MGGAAYAGIAAFFATVAFGTSYYDVEENEVSVELFRGKISDIVTEAGPEFHKPFGLETRKKIPTGKMDTRIEGADARFRTAQELRFTAPIDIEYEVDPYNADGSVNEDEIKYLYRQTKNRSGDTQEIIGDIVELRVKAAANAVYGEVASASFSGDYDTIREEIMKRAQKALDEEGWPINILNVAPSAPEFDPASETELSKLATEQQKLERLRLEEINAQKRKDVSVANAEADAAYVARMAKEGVDPDTALCWKKAEEAGNSNAPGSPGCGDARTSPTGPCRTRRHRPACPVRRSCGALPRATCDYLWTCVS